jgi:hypothetical protein
MFLHLTKNSSQVSAGFVVREEEITFHNNDLFEFDQE